MRQYNEKPSSISNIGQDILGAARHNNDTYETPEELRKKAFKKASTLELKNLKKDYEALFKIALGESTESAKKCLLEYEFKKSILSCDLLNDFKGTTNQEFRERVLSEKISETRNILRKKFNSLCRVQYKIKYDIRPLDLPKYFNLKTKESFKEINGHQVTWETEKKSFDADFLKNKTRAVQFGNSLTENERIYVSSELVESIKILEKYFNYGFSKLGFSFGARGKPGSVAHYQDSQKVLAFNRGCNGAFLHELGHAIDYTLRLPSDNIPYSIRSKYRQKLNDNKIPNLDYYMKNKEIFARLFEVFCKSIFEPQDLTDFLIFNFTDKTLPDLDSEALEYIIKSLDPILKKINEQKEAVND